MLGLLELRWILSVLDSIPKSVVAVILLLRESSTGSSIFKFFGMRLLLVHCPLLLNYVLCVKFLRILALELHRLLLLLTKA